MQKNLQEWPVLVAEQIFHAYPYSIGAAIFNTARFPQKAEDEIDHEKLR